MKIKWRYTGDENTSLPALLMRKTRTFVRLKLGIPRPDEHVDLLGTSLRLRQDTVPRQPDEDHAWVLACTQHAQTMFDIGCNVGYTALLGLVGGAVRDIVLVDASAEALSIAAYNLIQNQLSDHARFVCAFAAETDSSKVTFFTGNSAAASSAYIDSFTHSYIGQKIEVQTVSVDSLVVRFDLVPDFIKVDVEGAEDVVLVGASDLAAKGQTRFLVEVHHHATKPIHQITQRILEWCQQTAYTAWLLKKHEPLTDAATVTDETRYHVLLQPSDWDYPQWLRSISVYGRPDTVLQTQSQNVAN